MDIINFHFQRFFSTEPSENVYLFNNHGIGRYFAIKYWYQMDISLDEKY